MEGREPAWEISRLPVPKWAGQSPSAPLPLLLDGSSHLPLLISLASLLCPQDHAAWMGLWRAGYWLGSSAGSPARVGQAIALRFSPALPGESLLPASPDLPGLRGNDPAWPPLLLPTSVPLRPTTSLCSSSRLLGHQRPRPVAGRSPSCGETLTRCLRTPPS